MHEKPACHCPNDLNRASFFSLEPMIQVCRHGIHVTARHGQHFIIINTDHATRQSAKKLEVSQKAWRRRDEEMPAAATQPHRQAEGRRVCLRGLLPLSL